VEGVHLQEQVSRIHQQKEQRFYGLEGSHLQEQVSGHVLHLQEEPAGPGEREKQRNSNISSSQATVP
jgi:hypothetical protein